MTLGGRGKVNLDFPPAIDAKRAPPTPAKGRIGRSPAIVNRGFLAS
jgi:hypothetical protein